MKHSYVRHSVRLKDDAPERTSHAAAPPIKVLVLVFAGVGYVSSITVHSGVQEANTTTTTIPTLCVCVCVSGGKNKEQQAVKHYFLFHHCVSLCLSVIASYSGRV